MLLSVLGETTNLHQICSLDPQKSSLMHIKKRLKEPFASTVFKVKYFIMAGSFLSFIGFHTTGACNFPSGHRAYQKRTVRWVELIPIH